MGEGGDLDTCQAKGDRVQDYNSENPEKSNTMRLL